MKPEDMYKLRFFVKEARPDSFLVMDRWETDTTAALFGNYKTRDEALFMVRNMNALQHGVFTSWLMRLFQKGGDV